MSVHLLRSLLGGRPACLNRGMGERVVVSPDKFKGSLTAAEVAAGVATGLVRGGFTGEIEALPVEIGRAHV